MAHGDWRAFEAVMNTFLASGGYPWTIIRVERRAEYMQALDAASVRHDIVPFTQFIHSCVREAETAGR